MIGHQLCGGFPVRRRLGVPDRLDRVAVPGEPGAGSLVQRGDLAGRGAAQFQLQQFREHVVVAEPRPGSAQRHHERARVLQVLKRTLSARFPGQPVRQFPVDPVQDRGAQQQPAHLFGLPVQHLCQQVLGNRPVGAGELGREPFRVRVPGQRQRRQPQTCRPPLGPLMQSGQGLLRQLHSRCREQLPCLVHAEPQLGLADLGQFTLQPQPVQPQPHVMPGRQHEPQRRRRPHDQQLKLPQRVTTQLVDIVDHQPGRLVQRRQIRQQPLHDRPPIQVRRRGQLLHQPGTGCCPAQRAGYQQPQPSRIPLIASHRYPRGALGPAGLADP